MTIRITEYEVSVLPETHAAYRAYAIQVQYRGKGKWRVYRLMDYLNANGEWTYLYRETGNDSDHLFDLATALRLAKEAAPHVATNGRTAQETLDLHLSKKAPNGLASEQVATGAGRSSADS